MPSISDKHRLRIFASASNGPTVCLALKDFDAGDGDSVVLIHAPDAPQLWRRIELDFDLMDVALAPDPKVSGAEYLGLASTGEAIVLSDPPIVTRINAEGIFRRIEPGKGMLSAFDRAGGQLLALGRGGQAYRLLENGTWQPVSATYPLEDDPTDHVNFLCAGLHPGDGALYFGGVAEPQTTNLDALTQALLRGDVDAFTSGIMNDVRRNYGTLWRFAEGRWTKVDLATSGRVTSILETDDRKLLLSTNLGLAAEIVAADRIEEVYARGDQKGIARLVPLGERLVAILNDELIALALAAGTDEALPVPPGFGGMFNLHPSQDYVWLADWQGLARWNGSGWDEVPIPANLLR